MELVRTVFQLPKLGRVAGNPGKIGHVQVRKWGIEQDEYISNIGLPSYWPNSMLVTVSPHSSSSTGIRLISSKPTLRMTCRLTVLHHTLTDPKDPRSVWLPHCRCCRRASGARQ